MEKFKSGNDFQVQEKRPSSLLMRSGLVLASLLGAFLIGCAIFYVWLYNQQIQNGYRLSKLYTEHEQLLMLKRKLRLEWSCFQDPFQLEEMGRSQFGLAPPRMDQKLLMR